MSVYILIADTERDRGQDPWNITKVIGFFKITGTDPLVKQLDPGSIVSRGRSVQPSVKYVDD